MFCFCQIECFLGSLAVGECCVSIKIVIYTSYLYIYNIYTFIYMCNKPNVFSVSFCTLCDNLNNNLDSSLSVFKTGAKLVQTKETKQY